MKLFFDDRDVNSKMCAERCRWLTEIGARPISMAKPSDEGFVFAGSRSIDDYKDLVARLPLLRDRPNERAPLLQLDTVLDALENAGVSIPTPRTWRIRLDDPIPSDITFPLFVRTVKTSWKLGGRISRVRTAKQLEGEAAELRRAFQWDAVILAREWLDLAIAGHSIYGPVPEEIRVWIVDGIPKAWTFHYLQIVQNPAGFPPTPEDLATIYSMGKKVAKAFQSRLIVADFARLNSGGWVFIEAGPGSCAGTADEGIFKFVAASLCGLDNHVVGTSVGDTFRS